MTGVLCVLAGSRGLDAASISAGWDDINIAFPSTDLANANVTVTWVRGGARNFSMTFSGPFQYRINSGSYTTYTVPFSVSSGNTLNFRVTGVTTNEGPLPVTIRDDARGSAIVDTFSYAASGYP
jgi:hypothetical protein